MHTEVMLAVKHVPASAAWYCRLLGRELTIRDPDGYHFAMVES